MYLLLRIADAITSNPPGFNLPQTSAAPGQITNILQIVFGVAGALALLFIVISGFRYIVSAGDPEAIKKAKNGLVYSVVGLIAVILAEVIVTFVVGQLG